MKILLGLSKASVSSLLFAATAIAAPVNTNIMYQQSNTAQKALYNQNYKKPLKTTSTVRAMQNKVRGKTSGSAHSAMQVLITGNYNIPSDQIKSVIAPYLKNSMNAEKTTKIREAVENYYKNAGYFLPVANVNARGKTLSIKIIEGRIKEVIVVLDNKTRDKKVLSNDQFLKLVENIENASPLRTKKLEESLLLINKIHGYKADYDLEPLPQIEGNYVANLIINISTERGQAVISADNNGLKEIGKYEFAASAQGYNIISNDSLIINGATSDKSNKFQMISAGYLKRLTPGTSLSVMAFYIKDNPYSSPSQDSTTTSIKARFDQYFALNNDYSVKLEVGAEQRHIKYYTQNIIAQNYRYWLGSVGGKLKVVDPIDGENWIHPYYNFTLNNASYSSNSSQPRDFKKSFQFFLVDWYRSQPLFKTFELFIHASYQGTNKLLPLDQQYAIGTHHTIRGYKIGMISADQGASGELELRYIHNFKGKCKKFLETLQVFGFYGATHFIDHNKTINSTNHPGDIYFDKSTLQSAGGGFRLLFPYKIYGEAIVAQPLTKHITINDVKKKNSTVYSFLISKDFTW